MNVRKRVIFHGRVQGVGFRYTAKHMAQSLGLSGWVRNECDGTVILEVQGRSAMIDKLLVRLNQDSYIEIEWLDASEIATEEETQFIVR